VNFLTEPGPDPEAEPYYGQSSVGEGETFVLVCYTIQDAELGGSIGSDNTGIWAADGTTLRLNGPTVYPEKGGLPAGVHTLAELPAGTVIESEKRPTDVQFALAREAGITCRDMSEGPDIGGTSA